MTKNSIISVISIIGDLSTEGVFLCSIPKSSLEYINNSITEIFDISHQSFAYQISFYIHHILHEDIPHLKVAYDNLLQKNKVERVEFRIKTHDERVKTVCCRCYRFDSKYIVGFVEDITGLKEREDYIIHYGAKKNTLLDMVTHNLSGPLNISKTIVESLDHAVHQQDIQNIKAHVKLIRDNTTHCIDIVNDFLEEEHLVSEQIEPKKNRFEVAEKIDTILERFRKSYHDYKFEMKHPEEGVFIQNDDIKFLQVINNLLSNAIKFSPEGSLISIIIEDQTDTCTIKIKDRGIGIPDELKTAIYQKYTPASRKGLKGEKSIGMGLFIVRKLLTLMNGQIDLKSKEGLGTTFTVTLPKAP